MKAGLGFQYSSNSKLPHGDHDQDGHADGIADHPRFSNSFLSLHYGYLDPAARKLVSGNLSPARLFRRCLFLRQHLPGGLVARSAQLHK